MLQFERPSSAKNHEDLGMLFLNGKRLPEVDPPHIFIKMALVLPLSNDLLRFQDCQFFIGVAQFLTIDF
jgi:hypothetical protein